MSTNVYNGYGFDVGDVSAESLRTFFRNEKHLDTMRNNADMKDLVPVIESDTSTGVLFDIDVMSAMNDYSGPDANTGIVGLIADIIYNETNVFMAEYVDDCDSIVYMPYGAPWVFSDYEKTLHGTDDLDVILIPYMRELGLEGEPEYKSMISYE